MAVRRAIVAALAALLAGCGASGEAAPVAAVGPTGPTGPTGGTGAVATGVVLGSGRAGAWTVELRSDRPLGTGIAALDVRVGGPGGAPVSDAAVTLTLARPSTGAVAPLLSSPAAAGTGAYLVDAVIPDACPDATGWQAVVDVERAGETGRATISGIGALERGLARAIETPGSRLLVAVRFPSALQAGSNPVVVSLHEALSNGPGWRPVADAVLHAVPWMPSMGHGSVGTVDPAPTPVAGAYAGSLAFSMPGEWETTFTILRSGTQVGQVAITVQF